MRYECFWLLAFGFWLLAFSELDADVPENFANEERLVEQLVY
jgi:hypothetical protein